jgi:hypothetical protein
MGRRFRPVDLGFPFIEVPFISVGKCIAAKWDEDHIYPLGIDMTIYSQVLAHAHGCPVDPYRRCICVNDERWLNSREIMWHEYAHVLARMDVFITNCNKGTETLSGDNTIEIAKKWKDGHYEEWQEVMKSFGLGTQRWYDGEGDFFCGNW